MSNYPSLCYKNIRKNDAFQYYLFMNVKGLITALAFVFGVMPMLFATGAGAASRLSLGTAVVFGMAVNAVVGTLLVPNFWELLQRFQEKYLSKVFSQNNVAAPVAVSSDDNQTHDVTSDGTASNNEDKNNSQSKSQI